MCEGVKVVVAVGLSSLSVCPLPLPGGLLKEIGFLLSNRSQSFFWRGKEVAVKEGCTVLMVVSDSVQIV